ncbi:MAG: hypothetical protein JWN04_5700 [Myxococcaceae bacterium]|nr:hypothetical protein [Myxococcaceae bacterium]
MPPIALREQTAEMIRRVWWLTWVGLLVLAPGLREARARAEATEQVVDVSMADGSPVEPALYETLGELATRLGVRLQQARSASDAWSSVRLATERDGAIDLTVSSRGQPAIQRQVAPAESADLQRETVAHVLFGIIEAQLAVEHARTLAKIQLADEPKETLTSDAEDAQAARHALRFMAGGALGVIWLGKSEPAPRLDSWLGVVSDRRLEPGLAVGLGAAFLPEVSQRSTHAQLRVLSARVRPSVVVARGHRVALELSVPLGLDVAFAQLRDDMRDGSDQHRSTRIRPVAGPALTGHLRLSRALALTLGAGADIDLAPRTLHFRGDPHAPPIVSLDRVRPYLTIGLSFLRGASAQRAR